MQGTGDHRGEADIVHGGVGAQVKDKVGQSGQDQADFFPYSPHMKTQNPTVVLFPATVPGDDLLFPLVQVFPGLVHCQAVEDDEVPDNLRTPLAGILTENGLVRPLAPAPLGPDRDRFMALIRDLRGRGEDYAYQLKALLGAGGDTMTGERRSSLISYLAGGAEDRAETTEMILWQARLVLKLAEQYDSEQKALEEEFDRIRAREEGLLNELRREQEQPFGLTRELARAGSREDGLVRLRLKAWTRLYCLGGRRPEDETWLVTDLADGCDLALETAERLGVGPAHPWLRILLPAGGNTDDSGTRERLMADPLYGLLLEQCQGPANGDPLFSDPDGDWAALLESLYPGSRFGRRLLSLYRCPLAPCDLLMETFGRDEGMRRPAGQPPAGGETVLGRLETVE